MTTPRHLVIVGDGLSGRLIAYALTQRDPTLKLTRLAATAHPPSSHVPGALMHPFPGRSLEPDADLIAAYEASRALLEALHQQRHAHIEPWLKRHNMWRPLNGAKLGKRYLNTYQRAPQPESIDHALLERAQLQTKQPDLAHFERAIVYGPTYVVRMPGLLDTLGLHLAPPLIAAMSALTPCPDGRWQLTLEGDKQLEADGVILATGTQLKRWLPDLPITLNGGELIVCEPTSSFDESVSAGGHLGTLPDGRWVFGSTYLHLEDEHDPDATLPPREDAQTFEELVTLISRQIPALKQVALEDAHIWRGMRAVAQPDRQPVVGEHPHAPNLFVLGALGSKGLLWAPSLAAQLADLILKRDDAIPKQAHINRFFDLH